MRRRGILLALLLAWPALAWAQAPAVPTGLTGTMRIVGGTPASPGSWPSMVQVIGIEIGPGDRVRARFSCGGTVVGERWVLTAAHCVRFQGQPVAAREMVVAEGSVRADLQGARIIGVSRIIAHPGYNPASNANDVALLELREASQEPRQKLLSPQDAPATLRAGRTATVIGYGATSNTGQGSPEQLMQLDLPFVDRNQCAADYSDFPGVTATTFGNFTICAGFREGGRDSCQGDSGGPLLMQAGSGQVQVGIVSWGGGDRRRGITCALPRRYGVYASVAHFESWIRQAVPDADFTSPPSGNPPGPSTIESQGGTQTARPAPPPQAGLAADSRCFAALNIPDVAPSQLAQLSVDVVQGSRLRVGTLATFRVRGNLTGELILYSINPAGEVVQLFPNSRTGASQAAGQTDRIIRAGQTVILPGPADGFRAQVRPPLGQGVLCAIVLQPSTASRAATEPHLGLRPIADPGAYQRQLRQAAAAGPGAALASRLVEVVGP